MKFDEAYEAAQNGDAQAMCELGYFYYFGTEVEASFDKAIEWWTKAAEKSNPRALGCMAWVYNNGVGVEKNVQKAVKFYFKAGELGDAEGQVFVAESYFYGKNGVERDYALAFSWYLKAAENNHVFAQYMIGEYNSFGYGNRQPDLYEGVRWYKKSADGGFALAQLSLAYAYENGEGIEKDYSKALYWYEQAANQGNPSAMLNLANMLSSGRGCEVNYGKAMELWQKSAEQGEVMAMYNLADAYCHSESGMVNYQEAVKWYEKAVEHGYLKANVQLGNILFNGEAYGVATDKDKAFQLFYKAFDNGDKLPKGYYDTVVFMLAKCYLFGFGTSISYENAKSLFERSEKEGDSEACYYLGEMYRRGKGVLKDESRALSYYDKCIRLWNEDSLVAIYQLAGFYAGLLMVNIDEDKAARYWTLSAEKGDTDSMKNLVVYYRKKGNIQMERHWSEKLSSCS